MLSSNFCHMFKNLDFVSKVYLHICFIAVMASLKCITHYILQDASYSKIKQVSEVNWERIQAAKAIREAKGGANYHIISYSRPERLSNSNTTSCRSK